MTLKLLDGWSSLFGAAVAASFSPVQVQLAFAVVSVGVIGMAHGASDLHMAPPRRRGLFLGLYGAVIVVCAVWWYTYPTVALPLFLLTSAIHFALEDAPAGGVTERAARGLSLITTPALLHPAEMTFIIEAAGGKSEITGAVVTGMAITGGITAAGIILFSARRRDWRLFVGTVALTILPPFVGFSSAFLLLHAIPQTSLRKQKLGCSTYYHYLHMTWPVLLAAVILAFILVLVMQTTDPIGIRSLFASLAALAMPHLLITPWFETQQDEYR